MGFLWESILNAILMQSLSCSLNTNIAINLTIVVVVVIVIVLVHFIFKDFEKQGEEFLARLVQRKQELDLLKRRSMIDSPLNIGNRISQNIGGDRTENSQQPHQGDQENITNPLHQ